MTVGIRVLIKITQPMLKHTGLQITSGLCTSLFNASTMFITKCFCPSQRSDRGSHSGIKTENSFSKSTLPNFLSSFSERSYVFQYLLLALLPWINHCLSMNSWDWSEGSGLEHCCSSRVLISIPTTTRWLPAGYTAIWCPLLAPQSCHVVWQNVV